MTVIFFHIKIHRDVFGYIPKEKCPCCNSARVFRIEELTEIKKLWGFIPAGEMPMGFVESCTYCEVELGILDHTLKKASRSWDPSKPLNHLVSETAPPFAIGEPPVTPGPKEIGSFLKSIQIRTQLFAKSNGGAGGLLGLALGACVGGFIGAKYLDNSISAWICGALTGVIVGMVWEVRQKSLWKASRLIDSLSDKHHLLPRDFLEEIRKPGVNYGVVGSVVRRKSRKAPASRA